MSKLFGILLLSLLVSSCITNKKLTYFQSKKFSEKNATFVENARPQYKIQSNDVLSIQVVSTLDNTTPNIFNLNAGVGGGINPAAAFYVSGYSVDEKGYINFPTIGRLMVANQSVSQIRDLVQQNVDKYLNNATVTVKLVSFKISVLGDVRNPGYHFIFNEQATLTEALALAGDLTINGNRRNVKLIRQTSKGNEVILLDLTDPNLLKSPYFYILPNDTIYVGPLRASLSRNNLGLLGTLFGAISATFIILNYFNNR